MYTLCVQLVHGLWIVRYFLLTFGGWAAVAITYMVTRRYLKDAWKEYSMSPYLGRQVPNPVPGTLKQLRLTLVPAGLAIAIAFSVVLTISDELHRADTFLVMLSLMLPTVWYSVTNYFHDVEQKRLEEKNHQDGQKSTEVLPA